VKPIKDIMPRNDKDQRHGYWVYTFNGYEIFYFKCFFINGVRNGYEEEVLNECFMGINFHL